MAAVIVPKPLSLQWRPIGSASRYRRQRTRSTSAAIDLSRGLHSHEPLPILDRVLKLRYGTERNMVKSYPDVNDPRPSAARPRGRPRSQQARRAILQATHELLAEGGVSSVTIEGIAARAGVGKPTIYRSWPNAHAVAMAALMESHAPGTPAKTESASGLEALRAQLHEAARMFGTPLGRSVTLMIAAAEQETELSKAFRNHFILARRNEARAFLTSAMSNGEIRRDLDTDTALDLIYAPVFYRLLMGHAPLTPRFMDEVLNLALQGLGAKARNRTS
jgi:AcrR family transcriptional regulator